MGLDADKHMTFSSIYIVQNLTYFILFMARLYPFTISHILHDLTHSAYPRSFHLPKEVFSLFLDLI